jgi:hypothetical protein
MTFDEVPAILNRIKYKPNFTITANRVTYDGLSLCVSQIVSDVRLLTPTTIKIMSVLSGNALEHFDEAALIAWVASQIKEMEIHEFKEWLQVDGKPLYAPHPIKY